MYDLKEILYKLIDCQLEEGGEEDNDDARRVTQSNESKDDDTPNKNNRRNIIPDPNYELQQLINMMKIPFYLEKLMTFTLLASINGLLYYLTVLPINCFANATIYKKGSRYRLIRTYQQHCTLFLIIIACLVLSRLDTSKVYHKIKRQNTMKLYMLFNVLEMCDKMLASIGQSLLNVSLSNESLLTNRTKRYRQMVLILLSTVYIIAHGYILIYQSISLNVAVNSYNNSLLTLLLSLQFAEIKSSIFKKIDKEGLFQLSISDIVQRFKLFLLLLIIIIRNTGAIINNSMSMDSLSILTLFNTIFHSRHHIKSLTNKIMRLIWSPLVSAFSCEIIVDWMKHAYITKFNRIKPAIYDKFLLIMSKDKEVSLSQFQERLGLTLPAYAVLTIVMVRPVIFRLIKDFMPLEHLPSILSVSVQIIWMLFVSFIILLLSRIIINNILNYLSKNLLLYQYRETHKTLKTRVTESDYVPGEIVDGCGFIDQKTREIIYSDDNNTKSKESIPLSIVEKRVKHDKTFPDSLETVRRYEMVSKRIW